MAGRASGLETAREGFPAAADVLRGMVPISTGPNGVCAMTRPRLAAVAALLGALFAMLAVVPASAENSASNARLWAKAFKTLPDGAVLALQYDQDTEVNMRLRDVLERDLESRGYGVVEHDAPYILRYRTEVDRKARTPQALFELDIGSGNDNESLAVTKAHVPLYERLTGKAIPKSGERFDLRIDVASEAGERVWAGEIDAVLGGVERNAAFRAMVPVLMAHFGQTTHNNNGK